MEKYWNLFLYDYEFDTKINGDNMAACQREVSKKK
jgi:hypothetical protein